MCALALGGIQNFPRVLAGFVSLILTGGMIAGGVAIVVGLIVLIVNYCRRQRSGYDQLRGEGEAVSEATSPPWSRDASAVQEIAAPYHARTRHSSPTPAVAWGAPRVRAALARSTVSNRLPFAATSPALDQRENQLTAA